MPPTGDSGSPAPIDRPILEFLQTRLQAAQQVAEATITHAHGHLELRVMSADAYYPTSVDEAQFSVRWYTNDDFTHTLGPEGLACGTLRLDRLAKQ